MKSNSCWNWQGRFYVKSNSAARHVGGSVASALRSRSGRTYSGICVDLCCGIRFCAEHAAVAEMLKARETEIESIVAVSKDGILVPCGRCRELMVQVNPKNFNAKAGMPDGRSVLLQELLPEHWISKWQTPS